MADWITEGCAERSRFTLNPVRHLLVHGAHRQEWVLWCSSSRGRKDYNPHSSKFCRECRGLAQEAIDDGTLDLSDVHGWPVTAPAGQED